jgi:hypothetical protein
MESDSDDSNQFLLNSHPPYYGDLVEYLNYLDAYRKNHRHELARNRIQVMLDFTKVSIENYEASDECGQFHQRIYQQLFYLEEHSSLIHSRRIPLTRDGRVMLSSNRYGIYVPSGFIADLYMNEFYNPEVLKFIRCNLNLMFNNDNMNSLSRYWISNIQMIGDKSLYGEVSSASVGGYSEMVVFKSSKSIENNKIIEYENLVGYYINTLRELGNINLTYTYGLLKCSYDKLCTPGTPVLMLEHVRGMTYGNYLRTIGNDTGKFMSSIIQLIYSLNWAYKYMRFLHIDLHYSNIIARPGPQDYQEFYIRYPTSFNEGESDYVYVKSTIIPTIIDYGRTSVDTSGILDDSVGDIIYPVDSPFTNPFTLNELADIHKLLFMLYTRYGAIYERDENGYRLNLHGHRIESRPPIHQDILNLVKYMLEFFLDITQFDEEKLNGSLSDKHPLAMRWESSYGVLIQLTDENSQENELKPTYDQFIQYIKNHKELSRYWNEYVTTVIPQGSKILNCEDGSCRDPNDVWLNRRQLSPGALDFLIMANEYIENPLLNRKPKINRKIVNELIYLIENESEDKGIVLLTQRILNHIPEPFRGEIESVL